MSDPVYTSLLIHRCTIRARTQTGTDDFGQPTYSWANEATSVPCRLQSMLGARNSDAEYLGAVKGGADAFQAVIAQQRLWLEYSRDIDSNNRITSVTDAAGVLLDETKDESGAALTYEVRLPTDPAGQQHHKMVYLELVTGTQQ